MTDPVCPLIFGTTGAAEWRRQWRDQWSAAQRAEFVASLSGFGILADGFDANSPFPPTFVAAPGSECWPYVQELAAAAGGAQGIGSGDPALATGGAGPEAIIPGIPTLPRSFLEELLSLPRRLLDALARLAERLRALLPSGSALLLLAAAAALLLLLYVTRGEARER